jgi:aspartyl-tRNA(Asn)/glutamyl-tRNA(Gln) amidotransferase subunit A
MSAPATKPAELHRLTLAELSQRLRSRQLSPVALAEHTLDRLERLGPKLNAVATLMSERGLEEARVAESEIKSGRWRGPLHGVPYGAKDLLAVRGAPTTWGAAPFRDQRFDRDATVVGKLGKAGAVLCAKLAMVECAGGLGYKFANASLQGPGRNPWDPGRWTGGSSSGSGAATAAGLVPFAIGSETWGSILCPSAFCGLTGVRPTYGLVSRAGAMALSWTFDKIGPMARSADDCRTVLAAIAGPDPDDPTTRTDPPRLDGTSAKPLRSLRAALIKPEWKGEKEVESVFDAAVAELRAAGLPLEEAKLPEFEAELVAWFTIATEAVSSFDDLFTSGKVRQLTDANAPLQRELWSRVTAADGHRLARMRRVMQEQMRDFFGRYDLIVSNNFQNVAPPVEADLEKALVGSDPVGAYGNACGLPSVALPCGFGQGGMPAGFQLMGPPLSEATLLDVARAYQARTDWHRRTPPGA